MTETPQPEKEEQPYVAGSEHAYKWAGKQGLRVVLPKSNELQLDIDDDLSLAAYNRTLSVLRQYIGCTKEEIHTSKSGLPRRHITLTLKKDVTPLERIALQAVLGSDRMREILSFVTLSQGDPAPTLFFEKPEIPESGNAAQK